jgi:hypothetical protein
MSTRIDPWLSYQADTKIITYMPTNINIAALVLYELVYMRYGYCIRAFYYYNVQVILKCGGRVSCHGFN